MTRIRYGWLASILLLPATLQPDVGADDRPPIVSLVSLMANPQAYLAKKVLVMGFCSLEFEDTAVYLHEEDYRRALPANSIWLDVDPVRPNKTSPVHERYCLVEGSFRPEPARNGRVGRLGHVTRLELLPNRAEHAARVRE